MFASPLTCGVAVLFVRLSAPTLPGLLFKVLSTITCWRVRLRGTHLKTRVTSSCNGYGIVSLPSVRMRSEGTVVGSVCLCLSVTLHLTSRVFVRLTKDITYLTGNEGQKLRTVFSETAPLQSLSAKKPICKYTTDGMAYHGLIDPRALRTSEAPEDATQGVYRLSHAI